VNRLLGLLGRRLVLAFRELLDDLRVERRQVVRLPAGDEPCVEAA
jgi:hypothetical protein